MAGMAFKGDSWAVVSKRHHVSLQCTDLNAESNTHTASISAGSPNSFFQTSNLEYSIITYRLYMGALNGQV